jgi:hypothetical protein
VTAPDRSLARCLVLVVASATVLVGAVVASGLARQGPADGQTDAGPREAAETPSTALPARHTGPQGRVGQFVATCAYSHTGPHDPIVHPGHAGASHSHDFYGSVGLDESSTAETMLDDDTTCDKAADTAGYWHPTLYDHGEPVEPTELHAYYRAAPGVDPAAVETMPLGLALVAGDMTATAPQSGEVVGWTCGARSGLRAEPPDCPAGAPLHLVLTFQDCWDGEHLDSEDHASHVDYSTGGACPTSHPVHLPQLTVRVRFSVHGDGHDLALASGSVYSAHGDFLNAWEPEGLQREVEACIHRDVVCELVSNRGEDPLFGGSR